MSASTNGARSPDTIRSTLSRVGVQLCVKLKNGSVYYGDVKLPPQRDGTFALWLWGTSAPTSLCVADVVIAAAANIESHREFSEIRTRQRRELEGKDR